MLQAQVPRLVQAQTAAPTAVPTEARIGVRTQPEAAEPHGEESGTRHSGPVVPSLLGVEADFRLR